MKHHHRKCRGFTLIELLTVMCIIAILSTVSYGAYALAKRKAIYTKTTTQLNMIKTQLEDYKLNNGSYPDIVYFRSPAFQNLLGNKINFDTSGNPLDPWGNPFIYANITASTYELFSTGHDGLTGTPETNSNNIY